MCRLHDGAVSITTALHTLAVDSRSALTARDSVPCLLSAVVVDILEVECMEMTWDIAVTRVRLQPTT